MFRIRLKITFRFVDEISAYVGANSFALGDLSRPHTCCSSKFREVISRPILNRSGRWGQGCGTSVQQRHEGAVEASHEF